MASHGTTACHAPHRLGAAGTGGEGAEGLRVRPDTRPTLPPATVDALGIRAPAPCASSRVDLRSQRKCLLSERAQRRGRGRVVLTPKRLARDAQRVVEGDPLI
jgi:hypothetical protein